jgi:hypothetical protein
MRGREQLILSQERFSSTELVNTHTGCPFLQLNSHCLKLGGKIGQMIGSDIFCNIRELLHGTFPLFIAFGMSKAYR